MSAVQGIYDGKRVKITDRLKDKKRYKVVVTFIEELPLEENEIRDFASKTESFEFWENLAEDIYN